MKVAAGQNPLFPDNAICDFVWTKWPYTGETLRTCAVLQNSQYDAYKIEKPGVTILPALGIVNTWIKGFEIINNRFVKYIPLNIGKTFENLLGFKIVNCQLENVMSLKQNIIKTIEAGAFDDLKGLEKFELYDNKIRKLDQNIFAKLLNLRIIELNQNRIEKIDERLFAHNKKLEHVNLNENNIKFLLPETFNNLPNLRLVNLTDNNCVNDSYDTFRLNQLKFRLRENCKNLSHLEVVRNELKKCQDRLY